MLLHELHEQTEFGAIHRMRHIGSAHMVYHHLSRQGSEEVPQLRQVDGFKVNHHMPAQGFDALGDFQQFVFGREVDQALDKVKAHTAYTRVVHGL